MRKLIALLFCVAILSTAAQAQNSTATKKGVSPKKSVEEMAKRKSSSKELDKIPGLQKALAPKADAAKKQTAQPQAKPAPIKIKGDKRLVTVTLEVPEHFEEGFSHYHYWNCPAVIFNKDGALAFDGECWKAFNKASQLSVGRLVHFTVDLKELGEYTYGKNATQSFYFDAAYVADEGDEYTRSVDDAFRVSPDHTYIIYNFSLFNDPKNENNIDNSEVKRAIAKYYQDNALEEVNAETLSKYFKQTHPKQKTTDRPAIFHPDSN